MPNNEFREALAKASTETPVKVEPAAEPETNGAQASEGAAPEPGGGEEPEVELFMPGEGETAPQKVPKKKAPPKEEASTEASPEGEEADNTAAAEPSGDALPEAKEPERPKLEDLEDTIKVDGKERKLKYREIKEIAQKNLAIGERFRELSEAKADLQRREEELERRREAWKERLKDPVSAALEELIDEYGDEEEAVEHFRKNVEAHVIRWLQGDSLSPAERRAARLSNREKWGKVREERETKAKEAAEARKGEHLRLIAQQLDKDGIVPTKERVGKILDDIRDAFKHKGTRLTEDEIRGIFSKHKAAARDEEIRKAFSELPAGEFEKKFPEVAEKLRKDRLAKAQAARSGLPTKRETSPTPSGRAQSSARRESASEVARDTTSWRKRIQRSAGMR